MVRDFQGLGDTGVHHRRGPDTASAAPLREGPGRGARCRADLLFPACNIVWLTNALHQEVHRLGRLVNSLLLMLSLKG